MMDERTTRLVAGEFASIQWCLLVAHHRGIWSLGLYRGSVVLSALTRTQSLQVLSSLLDARQRQDAREDAIGVEILARELPRRERMSGIVLLNRLEAPRRTLEVSIGEQPHAYRDMSTEAGILHHHGPPGGQVATASVADPAALPEGIDRSHGRELASRSVYIPAVRVRVSDPLAGGHDPPPVGAQRRQVGIRVGDR